MFNGEKTKFGTRFYDFGNVVNKKKAKTIERTTKQTLQLGFFGSWIGNFFRSRFFGVFWEGGSIYIIAAG